MIPSRRPLFKRGRDGIVNGHSEIDDALRGEPRQVFFGDAALRRALLRGGLGPSRRRRPERQREDDAPEDPRGTALPDRRPRAGRAGRPRPRGRRDAGSPSAGRGPTSSSTASSPAKRTCSSSGRPRACRPAGRDPGRGSSDAGLSEEAARRRVDAYSTGMRQRLRLAFALLFDPPLLVLDEPFSGLDAAGREVVRRVVAEARGARRRRPGLERRAGLREPGAPPRALGRGKTGAP